MGPGGYNSWTIPHDEDSMSKGRNGWFTPRRITVSAIRRFGRKPVRDVHIDVRSKQTYGEAPIQLRLPERDAKQLMIAIASELGIVEFVLDLEVAREITQPGKADHDDLSA